MSECTLASPFGESASIDKNKPKIKKTATIAPTSISRLPPSVRLECNWRARVARFLRSDQFYDFTDRVYYHLRLVQVNPVAAVFHYKVLSMPEAPC